MSTFIQSIDFHMWSMIEFGYSPPFQMLNGNQIETPLSPWTLEERKLTKLNAKCLNFFFYALKLKDYMCVSNCKNRKKIKRECLLYEGINDIK